MSQFLFEKEVRALFFNSKNGALVIIPTAGQDAFVLEEDLRSGEMRTSEQTAKQIQQKYQLGSGTIASLEKFADADVDDLPF